MVRPLDESQGSSPLQGYGSWLMCEVALSVIKSQRYYLEYTYVMESFAEEVKFGGGGCFDLMLEGGGEVARS